MINFQAYSFQILSILFFVTLLLLATISSTCPYDAKATKKHNSNTTLKYKLGSKACIHVVSAIGVCIPFVGKKCLALNYENPFFLIKAFATSLILVIGFIHILLDAFKNLTSPYLDQNLWGSFPFTGFFVMTSTIET